MPDLKSLARPVVVIAAVLLAPALLSAAGIASVDYSVLMAFHPQMARFDFLIQRFFLPDLDLTNTTQMESVRRKMAERAKQGLQERQSIERDRNRVQREIARVEESSQQTINSMLRENKDVSAYQKTYQEKLKGLNAELAELDRKLAVALEIGLEQMYMSREKSQALFSQIQNEIDQHLAAVSREKGGLAIVDRSFLAPPAPTFSPAIPVTDIDPVTADLYTQLLKFDFTLPPVEGQTPPGHDERMREGLEARFRDQMQRYLSQCPALRPVISNYRGRMLVAGGEDLTATVLSRILDAHQTRPEVKARLLQLLAGIP